jgi:hypothetical protein
VLPSVTYQTGATGLRSTPMTSESGCLSAINHVNQKQIPAVEGTNSP